MPVCVASLIPQLNAGHVAYPSQTRFTVTWPGVLPGAPSLSVSFGRGAAVAGGTLSVTSPPLCRSSHQREPGMSEPRARFYRRQSNFDYSGESAARPSFLHRSFWLEIICLAGLGVGAEWSADKYGSGAPSRLVPLCLRRRNAATLLITGDACTDCG